MSLVGSLEDLGLADILQIVSLSRKSGLLLLRSDDGDGRIVFQDGLVRAATVKGEPEDLRGLLVPGGFAVADVLDRALETARETGLPVDEVVAQRTGIPVERLDSLRREHVERAVLRMFSWRVGEFSFEVRSEIASCDAELSLATGINTQYLMMEATRLGDESLEGDAQAPLSPPDAVETRSLEFEQPAPVFSGEGEGLGPQTSETDTGDADSTASFASAPLVEEPTDSREALAVATAMRVDAEPEAEPPAEATAVESGAPASASSRPAPSETALVVIDPELRVLEWIKSTLRGCFVRIHIFQQTEAGVARIRQYLARGQLPVVLMSSQATPDPLAGVPDVAELLRRLRAQAPRMSLLVLHDDAESAQFDAADALVARPPVTALGHRRRQNEVDRAAQALRAALLPGAQAPACRSPGAADAPSVDTVRARLRDPSTRGDILSLALDFAAGRLNRVAMFMVRDDHAVGIAQRGLPSAGGPDDEGFRGVRLPLDASGWLRRVLESRKAVAGAPQDEGDRALLECLGDRTPQTAYLAPIVSGGRVAALLYGDRLPELSPVGDIAALDAVLREAGLALDRALVERAAAEGAEAPQP